MSEEVAYVTSAREVWFSDIPAADGGFELTYKADSNQLNFLKMLSSSASQNVTYHCFNSVAYRNAKRGHMRQAIQLMSSNDLELRHRGKFRYKVLSDECQVRYLFSNLMLCTYVCIKINYVRKENEMFFISFLTLKMFAFRKLENATYTTRHHMFQNSFHTCCYIHYFLLKRKGENCARPYSFPLKTGREYSGISIIQLFSIETYRRRWRPSRPSFLPFETGRR